MLSHELRGSAAIAAVISLAILIVLGSVLARIMKTEAASTKNFHDGIAAQMIAEAGLRRAVVVLYTNGDPHGLAETVEREFFTDTYHVSAQMEGESLRISSVGSVGSARRTASVSVRLGLDADPDEALLQIEILSWAN